MVASKLIELVFELLALVEPRIAGLILGGARNLVDRSQQVRVR